MSTFCWARVCRTSLRCSWRLWLSLSSNCSSTMGMMRLSTTKLVRMKHRQKKNADTCSWQGQCQLAEQCAVIAEPLTA